MGEKPECGRFRCRLRAITIKFLGRLPTVRRRARLRMPLRPKKSILNGWGRVKPRQQRVPKMRPLPEGIELAKDEATQTRIAYNPPASLMDPLVTPPPFIPLHMRSDLFTGADTRYTLPADAPLPPALNPKIERPVLSAGQIEELRAARESGASINALARKYGCSTLFVSLVAPAAKGAREERDAKHATDRRKWSDKKRALRTVQAELRDNWGYTP